MVLHPNFGASSFYPSYALDLAVYASTPARMLNINAANAIILLEIIHLPFADLY
jgi:hypothetical protein